MGIGDRDVGPTFGRWPFPRAVHADVLAILNTAGARHCTLDVLFTEPSADAVQDEKLIAGFVAHKNTTLAYHFDEAAEGGPGAHFLVGQRYGAEVSRFDFVQARNPVPPFAALPTSFGAVNAVPDGDGMIRKVPLFFAHGGKLYPSLAMQTVLAALHVEPDQVQVVPGVAVTLVDTPNGTLRIPVDERCEYRVNFAGDLGVFAPSFQYTDLYAAVSAGGGEVFAALKDRVVVIGNVSTGNADIVNVPIGRIPGVAVQATVVSNILSGAHLRFLPPWAEGLLLVGVCVLFGAVLCFSQPWVNMALIVALALGWVLVVCGAAAGDWLLPFIATLGGLGCTGMVMLGLQMTMVRADRGRLLDRFSRYVSNALVKRIVEGGGAMPTQSKRRELTIFFSDVRGFTLWTERMDPDEVTLVLNQYFTAMTEVVERHGGTLDKFIGDAIMVFFGEPVEQPDHPIRAIRMAWEMQREIEKLNTHWHAEGREALHVGMGINTAFVTVGNFGSKDFTDYTVIGRGVNLAARIESWAPSGRILLSPRTWAIVQGKVEARLFAELRLKGIPEPVPVFEVLGFTGEELASVTPAEEWVIEGERKAGPFPQEGIEVMRQCGRINASAVVLRQS